MRLVLKVFIGSLLTLVVLFAGYYLYVRFVANPQVIEALRADPGGSRADRVMLITLPDGRSLPANYLREGGMVYIGVDGRWWRLFRDAPQRVSLLIRGETVSGGAVAVLDDPAHTDAVFARLRPAVPSWLPGRMRGVLVEVTLDDPAMQGG